MPTYTVNIYNNDPLFILSGTVGNTASWTGEANPSGTATITDNEPGLEGQTIDSSGSGGESATADVTVGGDTSTGAGIYAEESWTLRDTVTGDTFNVITFRVTSGSATGYYTLSETPLVTGRSYETLDHDTDPDVTAGDPAFSIDDYVEAGFEVDGTSGDDNIDASYVDADGDSVGGGNDTVLAGAGNDTVFAGAGDDTVSGGTGSDSIHGGDGDDSLVGADGDDTLIGGAGADTLSGGAGLDIVDYSASDAAVNVDLSTGTYGGGDAEGDTGSGIDGIIGSDFNDTLTGFDGVYDGGNTTNYIDGGAGNDFIDGLDGGDTLIGGADNDTVLGGGGDDELYGDGTSARWAYEVYTQDFSSANGQAFTIENGTLAGSGTQDTLDIDALGQAATGQGDPNDFGVIFTSTLYAPDAGTYRFTTTSDDGSTLRILDSQGDPLDFTNQTGNDGPFLDNDYHQAPTTRWGEVTLEAGQTYTIEVRVWENAGGEVLSGTVTAPGGTETSLDESPLILGVETTAGDDSLDGGAGADLLFGGGGDDTLVAGENDTLVGGDGDDLFILGNQTETGDGTISITGGEGGETGGDTLQLTADVGQDDITFTNTDDAAGGLSGNFTLSDGTAVSFSEIENIICFTPGARILTEQGERPVEGLRPGDKVITRDHGAQPLRWVGRRTVPGTGRFAPVRVAAHVLDGACAPLTVSPQHRFLFTGYKAELLFGCDEVLIAAKHLVDGQAVTQTDQAAVTYIHLMFDRHEVIYAEGAATESFHVGDIGLSAIAGGAREELFALFPELRSHPESYGPTARPCLRRHEARLLMPAA